MLLAGELDIGMARSRQRNCLRDAAAALGANYVFGAEFLELGLGDVHERRIYAGQTNSVGLHGNGLLSSHRLEDPALIRLETDGDWFDGRHGERRVGGRCAVAARIRVKGRSVLMVSVHLESHSGPALRAEYMRRLFKAIDRIADGEPVVVGGDLNTSTLERTSTDQTFDRAALARNDPERFVRPERYEPLFGIAAAEGYSWQTANAPGPTERPDDAEDLVLGKIDWFLVRGAHASRAKIVPAVDPAGKAISDHDAIAITVTI